MASFEVKGWKSTPPPIRNLDFLANGFDINFQCYDSQLGVIQYRLKLSHFLMASPFNIVLVDFDKYRNALKKLLSLSLHQVLT